MNPRIVEIDDRLYDIEVEEQELMKERAHIQARCTHPKLPIHALGEEYMDRCPDCGFVSYCYSIG